MSQLLSKADELPQLQERVLALEIKNAREHFQTSSEWLSSMAGHIASFPEESMEASELLEKLERRSLKGKIKISDSRRVYAVLKKLRIYSRQLAITEPLDSITVVEHVAMFDNQLKNLRRLLKTLKDQWEG